MNFEYNQQMEEFSMFDFVEEIHDTNLVTDEWNSYYETEDYDDQSWAELGGVNAEENQLFPGGYTYNPLSSSYSTTTLFKGYRVRS